MDVKVDHLSDTADELSVPSELNFPDAQFNNEELECLNRLEEMCQESQLDISKETMCRFAIFSGFNVRRARAAILKKHNHPYLNLRLEDDLYQFIKQSKVVFPLPGLKSILGSSVLYFRPSRYEPSASNNRLIVENICYVLNDMSRTVDHCRGGVMEIINLEGYSLKNFHLETLRELTKVDHGEIVPTTTKQFLVINAPKAFEIVWNIGSRFRSVVHDRRYNVIKIEQLKDYLVEGYEAYLPDELFPRRGKPTADIVANWIDSKKAEEKI